MEKKYLSLGTRSTLPSPVYWVWIVRSRKPSTQEEWNWQSKKFTFFLSTFFSSLFSCYVVSVFLSGTGSTLPSPAYWFNVVLVSYQVLVLRYPFLRTGLTLIWFFYQVLVLRYPLLRTGFPTSDAPLFPIVAPQPHRKGAAREMVVSGTTTHVAGRSLVAVLYAFRTARYQSREAWGK